MPSYLAPLPPPPLVGDNPYADFAAYLDRLVHLRLQAHHSSSIIVLIAFTAYAILLSIVYFFGHWRRMRKERKPLWFARIVQRPQGKYIALNQAVASSIVNFCVFILWLAYLVYLQQLWEGSSTSGRNYLYFLDVSHCILLIPLFLVTFLVISAGNLTTHRNGEHPLGPKLVNSLLVVIFPALFILLFVPSIIAGHAYHDFIELASSLEDGARQTASSWNSAASDRQAAVRDILNTTFTVLNPSRDSALSLQRNTRIIMVVVFSVLLIVNLLGFVFVLRHLRQTKSGQLVMHKTSVVAPLATHPHAQSASPADAVSISLERDSPISGGKGTFGRTLTRTGTVRADADPLTVEQEEYGRGETRRDEQTRPPWDVMINYFCVPLICALVIAFVSWAIKSYASTTAFNGTTTIEIASASVIWAYTIVNITTTTALIIKKLREAHAAPAPQFADNPFNTRTGRRDVQVVVPGQDELREKRAGGAGAGVLRPSNAGRKLSIVSLASSVGSRFSFSGASANQDGRRGSYPASVEEDGKNAPSSLPEEQVRGHNGTQSLMAGVHQVIEVKPSEQSERKEGL
ncbi:hypothetical protein JCM8547_007346 [Rhodosporidiobolus lusitaniae]